MHTDLATTAPPAPHPRSARASRRRGLDRFELVVLAAFGGISVWVLTLDLWQVVVHGRAWMGTDGLYLVDQMQYLAWIRDASAHVLASNLFVLRSTPADYIMPAVAISGGVSALGVAPWLALLLWKPVAVLAVFFAVRAYVRRMLAGLWARRAALVLGRSSDRSASSTGRGACSTTCFPGSRHGVTRSGCWPWRRWSRRCSHMTAAGPRAGSPGRRDCSEPWPARCIPGRVSC